MQALREQCMGFVVQVRSAQTSTVNASAGVVIQPLRSLETNALGLLYALHARFYETCPGVVPLAVSCRSKPAVIIGSAYIYANVFLVCSRSSSVDDTVPLELLQLLLPLTWTRPLRLEALQRDVDLYVRYLRQRWGARGGGGRASTQRQQTADTRDFTVAQAYQATLQYETAWISRSFFLECLTMYVNSFERAGQLPSRPHYVHFAQVDNILARLWPDAEALRMPFADKCKLLMMMHTYGVTDTSRDMDHRAYRLLQADLEGVYRWGQVKSMCDAVYRPKSDKSQGEDKTQSSSFWQMVWNMITGPVLASNKTASGSALTQEQRQTATVGTEPNWVEIQSRLHGRRSPTLDRLRESTKLSSDIGSDAFVLHDGRDVRSLMRQQWIKGGLSQLGCGLQPHHVLWAYPNLEDLLHSAASYDEEHQWWARARLRMLRLLSDRGVLSLDGGYLALRATETEASGRSAPVGTDDPVADTDNGTVECWLEQYDGQLAGHYENGTVSILQPTSTSSSISIQQRNQRRVVLVCRQMTSQSSRPSTDIRRWWYSIDELSQWIDQHQAVNPANRVRLPMSLINDLQTFYTRQQDQDGETIPH